MHVSDDTSTLWARSAPQRHGAARMAHLSRETPGRSPGSQVQRLSRALSAASSFPGLTIEVELLLGRGSLLTVAGPRRICTGFPVDALAGTRGESDCQRRGRVSADGGSLSSARTWRRCLRENFSKEWSGRASGSEETSSERHHFG